MRTVHRRLAVKRSLTSDFSIRSLVRNSQAIAGEHGGDSANETTGARGSDSRVEYDSRSPAESTSRPTGQLRIRDAITSQSPWGPLASDRQTRASARRDYLTNREPDQTPSPKRRSLTQTTDRRYSPSARLSTDGFSGRAYDPNSKFISVGGRPTAKHSASRPDGGNSSLELAIAKVTRLGTQLDRSHSAKLAAPTDSRHRAAPARSKSTASPKRAEGARDSNQQLNASPRIRSLSSIKVGASSVSPPTGGESRHAFTSLGGLISGAGASARAHNHYGRPERLRPDRIFNPPLPANSKGATISSKPRAAAASDPTVVINSSPTIVIHAGTAGDLERQVLEALRNYRSELYDEWRREVARRERTEF